MSDTPAPKKRARSRKAGPKHDTAPPAPPPAPELPPAPASVPHPPKPKPTLAQTVRRLALFFAATVISGLLVEGALIVATRDGRTKVIHSNQRVWNKLAQMQPFALTVTFFGRLTEQHTWHLLQWDAPFNADVARQRLVTSVHDPLAAFDCYSPGEAGLISSLPAFQAGALPCYFHTPPGEAAAPTVLGTAFSLPPPVLRSPRPPLPPGGIDPAEQARQRADFLAGNARISRLGGPRLSGSGMETLFAFVLGLPDAYLAIVQALVPHMAVWVQIVIVIAAFYAGLMALAWLGERYPKAFANAGVWPLFLLLIFLPLAVSSAAGLLLLLAKGMLLLFGGMGQFLQSILVVPTTAGAVGSPAMLWVGSKVMDRRLEEALLRRLPRAWIGEE